MRQKPIGDFIVDFYCSALRLVIEIDGDSHGYAENQKRDESKGYYLDSIGLTVLRFDDLDVKQHISSVIEDLLYWIDYSKESK